MKRLEWALLLVLMLALAAVPIYAQDDEAADQITDSFITFDEPVTDTITERSFYDLWSFYAEAGDHIIVTMIADDGLAPLLGVAASAGEVVLRSDEDADGNRLPDALPNDTVEIEFTIETSGQYTLVPTRVGNANGTTTGSYTLLLRRANPVGVTEGGAGVSEVTFRCGPHIVTNAVTLDFLSEGHVDAYRISVYALDGFTPLLRITVGDGLLTECSSDPTGTDGDQILLPSDEQYTLPDPTVNAARFSLRGQGRSLGPVQVTLGSVDGVAGRYLLVVDGFELTAPDDRDLVEVRRGPLAAESDMLVYMVSMGRSRLDPELRLEGNTPLDDFICDDAGRFDCDDVPAIIGVGVILADGTAITGGRFDAGAWLRTGTTEKQAVYLHSRGRSTAGPYAVVIMGELPPRQNAEEA